MRHGMTLLELLLVVGLVAVFAASGAPYVARSLGWVYELSDSEHQFNQLYDVSLLIGRHVATTGDAVQHDLVGKDLKIDDTVIIGNVTKWSVTDISGNKAVKCEITTESSRGEECFLRFLVLKP